MNGSSSMLYTMGMAISRAADLGFDVSVLVDGQWLRGRIAAHDGTGLVLEQDHEHSVVRMQQVNAVTIHAESPYQQQIATGAMPMPGPRLGADG